ncbi:MAG: polysaccharide deacetylase family protein [Actinomycetes bacterium]
MSGGVRPGIARGASGDHGRAIVVTFHGIGDPWPGVPGGELPYWCPAKEWPGFAETIADLQQRSVTPLEVTFDDGNASDLEHGLPALVRCGVTATFFACAGRLGDRHFLSAADLRSLRAAGMGIGSHGWAHTDLRRADDRELGRAAEDSRATLSDAIGEPVDRFAIPFGSYDRRVLRALRGYRAVYTSDQDRAQPDAWLVPRFSYTRAWTPDTLRRLASDTVPAAARLRRGLARAVKRLR